MATLVDEQCYIHGILFPPRRGSASWFVSHWWRRGICRLVSSHPPTSSITEHPSTDHSSCVKYRYQNIATKLIRVQLVILLGLLYLVVFLCV